MAGSATEEPALNFYCLQPTFDDICNLIYFQILASKSLIFKGTEFL
jgi:hypothetical protein